MPTPERDWTGVLQRIVDGDPLALVHASRLVNGFLVRWNAYDFRDEWEDLVQEVISAAALALRDGRLREPRAMVGFLWTTARFKYIDRLRIQLGPGSGERLPWEEIAVSRERPLEERLGAEAREDLRRALAKVPDKKREAVMAVYVGGLTYEEAARATGIPLGTLKRYLRDGLAQLRDELSDLLDGG
jgi:RNA polymerase sigma-70 factor (ECF subfamily)